MKISFSMSWMFDLAEILCWMPFLKQHSPLFRLGTGTSSTLACSLRGWLVSKKKCFCIQVAKQVTWRDANVNWAWGRLSMLQGFWLIYDTYIVHYGYIQIACQISCSSEVCCTTVCYKISFKTKGNENRYNRECNWTFDYKNSLLSSC